LGRRTFDRHAARLDEDLGRLCRGLSALRDAQALIEELARLETSATAETAETLALAKVVARHRRDQMLERLLKRDPGLESRRQRLLQAQTRLDSLDWNALDERAVLRSVGRSRRRAAKAGPRAERRPDDEEAWHVYRRRMRRLHQQHTLLATIQPGLLPPTMGLDAHAGALGEFQDDVLLLRRCGNHSPFPATMRPLLRRIARERLRKARRG
jgi:CHAD domain